MKTIEFKPSFTRYLLGNLLMFSVGYALATALPGLLFPPFDARSWLVGILITVVVVGLLIPLEFAMLRKRLVVSINNQEVYTWKRKHVIALNKVDMEKSRKRSIGQILLGHYQIRAIDGQKISIDVTTRSWREYTQILDAVITLTNTPLS